jgi:hypothetical protein
MVKMNQPSTDMGTKHETGEKEPKGSTSSDKSGEKSTRKKNGVAMGKADKGGSQEGGVGRSGTGGKEHGEFNSGKSESDCYSHKRVKHEQG